MKPFNQSKLQAPSGKPTSKVKSSSSSVEELAILQSPKVWMIAVNQALTTELYVIPVIPNIFRDYLTPLLLIAPPGPGWAHTRKNQSVLNEVSLKLINKEDATCLTIVGQQT